MLNNEGLCDKTLTFIMLHFFTKMGMGATNKNCKAVSRFQLDNTFRSLLSLTHRLILTVLTKPLLSKQVRTCTPPPPPPHHQKKKKKPANYFYYTLDKEDYNCLKETIQGKQKLAAWMPRKNNKIIRCSSQLVVCYHLQFSGLSCLNYQQVDCELSLFCLKIHGEERKNLSEDVGKHDILSLTNEQQSHEP